MPASALAFARHFARREHHGISGRHGLAAGETAEPDRHDRRIARDHADGLRMHAQFGRADLRQRGGESLAHGGGAGQHRHAPRAAHTHESHLERSAAGAFQPMREPDADIAARFACFALTAREILPFGAFQHLSLGR